MSLLSLEIYLVILCVAVVNAQRTTDPQYAESCEADQRTNQALQMLERCQLVRQQMKTNYIEKLMDLQNKYENVTRVLNAILQQQKQDEENAPKEECRRILNASSFLDNPRLLDVINTDEDINGLAVLNDQLFVVRARSTQVNVYYTNNMTLTRNITIPSSSSLHAIVASVRYNCLYISDILSAFVHRYNLSDNVVSRWPVGDRCFGLSLTGTHSILATLYDTKRIREYTPDGSLVKEISFDSSVEYLWHSVQLANGQFVISHGVYGAVNRVCKLDKNGSIINCYGGPYQPDGVQLSTPCQLAVDEYDNVLVANYHNSRVQLLSPSLTHLGYINIPGHTLNQPSALHLDLLTHRLYIGEGYDPARAFVLTV